MALPARLAAGEVSAMYGGGNQGSVAAAVRRRNPVGCRLSRTSGFGFAASGRGQECDENQPVRTDACHLALGHEGRLYHNPGRQARVRVAVPVPVMIFDNVSDKLDVMKTNRSRQRLWRRIRILAALAVVGVGGLAGFVWWQEAPLRAAEEALGNNKPQEALQLVDGWRKVHGDTGAALALRARCLVELGYDAEALRVFSIVGAETSQELHAWARAQLRSEHWAQALPLLEAVLKQTPENADVLHELSACCARLGMLDRAIDYATRFSEHADFHHRGLLMIGMLRKQQGNKSAAAEAWEQIADSPDQVADLQVPGDEFLTELAAVHLDLGNAERAAELLERAVGIRETANGRYYQGLAAEQTGQAEPALEHWKRALILEPEHQAAREALARTALADGQPDLAENYLSPLLRHTPLRSSTAWLMQRIETLRGNDEQTRIWTTRTDELRHREKLDSTVRQMLRENPNSYWAIVVRSYQFAESGNWDQAEAMLSTLPEDKPEEFVVQLRQAIQNRSALPSVELLPIELF